MLPTSTPFVSLFIWWWKEYKITAVKAYNVETICYEVGCKGLADFMCTKHCVV